MHADFERRSSLRDFLTDTQQNTQLEEMINGYTLHHIADMISCAKTELQNHDYSLSPESINSLLLTPPFSHLHAIHDKSGALNFREICLQLVDLFKTTSPEAFQEWLNEQHNRRYPTILMPVVGKIVTLANGSK